MTTIWTLVRKDWRVFRAPTIASLLLFVGPYASALIYWAATRDSVSDFNRMRELGELLLAAAFAGIWLAAAMSAVFGGMAFALERRERTSDFVAMLPVTRWQILTSKALLSL